MIDWKLFSSGEDRIYMLISYSTFQDDFKEHTRDPQRTPMQWNKERFAGFTDGTEPWLPVNRDYETKNVKVGF